MSNWEIFAALVITAWRCLFHFCV